MITIISSANGVIIDFNGYYGSGQTKTKRGYWGARAITKVLNLGTYIEIDSTDSSWLLNTDGSDGLFGVGAIDSVTPTDIDHLYNLLIGAIS